MNEHQLILILDFGGQYNQLIARRVRECGVYCEVKPYHISPEEIKSLRPTGMIFTGGPKGVLEEDTPKCDPGVFSLGVPILGICYGQQLMAAMLGGTVVVGGDREYGKALLKHDGKGKLFTGIPAESVCWMSHAAMVKALPEGFSAVASTESCAVAAMEDAARGFFGVQFHPEVAHTEFGAEMLKRFLFDICNCAGDWKMADYADDMIREIREKVGQGKALLALSGGVDSSVCAALMSRAIGGQLTCIFVDHGLMRKDEGDEVVAAFAGQNLNLIRVDAEGRFLEKLADVTDPEQKRKIIGEEFIRVFEEEAKKIGAVDFLVQGTIYPDVIESGVGDGAMIKSHHNVGGLPDYVDFKEIIEPLRPLFKDEVRSLGTELGLSDKLVWRQPFPGPGLAVRVIGAITKEKLEILRGADAIFREEVARAGLDRKISQYFAVLTDMRSVGVTGDERTYDYTLALRGVVTSDFMTAAWAQIPHEVLEIASTRIANEVGHINRIVYDITSKPPATIEWE